MKGSERWRLREGHRGTTETQCLAGADVRFPLYVALRLLPSFCRCLVFLFHFFLFFISSFPFAFPVYAFLTV